MLTAVGRHKQYDPEEVLERARRVFHEKGFAATSVADLVEATGINKKSLYAEFGNKQALFEAALDRHLCVNNTRVVGPMEAPDAGLEEVRAALRGWGRGARGRGAGLGCLLCNTASERAARDPGARKHVRKYLRRLRAAFANALGNAAERGELADGVDVEAQAEFFTSHGIGQLTLIRAKVLPELVEGACEVALRHLDSLRARPRGALSS